MSNQRQRQGQLSQALLSGSVQENQGEEVRLQQSASDDDASVDECNSDVLSTTPHLIMGSPFPYLFQQPTPRRKIPAVESSQTSSMEQGDAAVVGSQPSKLVRDLVHASSLLSPPTHSMLSVTGSELSMTTALRTAAKQRARQGTRGPAQKGGPGKGSGLGKALVIGLVNVIVGVPALVSYTAIIFQAPEFKEYVGELAQLLFLASAITQAVFCLMSTLPFAVGQTQDVGLIFLSSMATHVAALGTAAALPSVEIVGTTLVTCLLATLLVGVCTILVGKYELAGLVQYIPLPVVGGYLAYVGFFCLVAGASVSINMPLHSLSDIQAVVKSTDALYMLSAAVASMAVILFAIERFTHPAALPIALVSVPIAFYGGLWVVGCTLGDAQEAGWVIKPNGSEPFWKVFELYNIHDWRLSGTYWPAVAWQVPKMIALFFVVAFGSSMDVAAIQQDMPEPLDFDKELITVGVANVATSLCGAGFTGSYIFSQTIFTKRQGVTHVANGWVIAVAELALFLLPISVVEYMPNFFYGSLLMVFGVDISRDWLVHSYHKVSRPEYLLLLATFLAVIARGLEIGIAAGIVLATCYFAVEYAKIRVKTFRVVPSHSGALRTFRQRAILDAFSSRMLAIGLEGYIFFGSALSIGDRCLDAAALLLQRATEEARSNSHGGGGGGDGCEGLWGGMAAQARGAMHEAPMFLLLDFGQVDGLDATAARTFGTIANQLHGMRIDLIITAVSKPSIRNLLVAHGAIPEENEQYDNRMALTFPSMDAGAQFVEECFLEVAVQHGLLEAPTRQLSLLEILTVTLEAPRFVLPPRVDLRTIARHLEQVALTRQLRHGEVLFRQHEPSDAFYVIQSGTMRLEFTVGGGGVGAEEQHDEKHRIFEYGPGGFVGDYDFILQSPRRFRAVAGSSGCHVWVFTGAAHATLLEKHPAALGVLQVVMLRNACMNERHALDRMANEVAGSAPHA